MKYILKFYCGILAGLSTAKCILHKPTAEMVDIIILLFYYNGDVRLNLLSNKLREKSVKFKVFSMPIVRFYEKMNAILTFSKLDRHGLIPILNYMLKTHNPKILVFQEDGIHRDVYSYLKKMGVLVVNIAHGITACSPLFKSLHYDYYFLFGQSSLDNIRKNKLADGPAELILAGSPYIKIDQCKKTSSSDDKFVLIAGTYFHPSNSSRNEPLLEEFYYKPISHLIEEYREYEFVYKPHITTNKILDKRYFLSKDNCSISNTDILTLSSSAKLIICDVSNCTIEAAFNYVPFIVLDWRYHINNKFVNCDYLRDIDYFERAIDMASLKKLFCDRIRANFDFRVGLTDFRKQHIARTDSVDFISNKLVELLNVK